ncbi:ATP-binding protein [Rhizobium sp. 2MFCol3.1]|uniref:ATP-dependent nuclease n=1 Tax=Rhizobium sp. 2MFCol3.1 TaxID=1246459 RepID=UPI0003A4C909|nr:ATP-binding protein [Rhizobium sp. 2MFCol3.1]
MGLERLTVEGYRGFTTEKSMEFAQPTGQVGSGLTVITGSNNSGKSSIIECLRARAGHNTPSFTTGMRNAELDKVTIKMTINGVIETLSSIRAGSSETSRSPRDDEFQAFILQSRRAFNSHFGKGQMSRTNYINNTPLPTSRSSQLDSFSSRLFEIERNQAAFNDELKKVLGFEPKWSIDLNDTGAYFLKFVSGKHSHTSDGLGEGIVSVFAIVDALYDSDPGSMVVIDEPELSLHPSLQKRVARMLAEYAKDRQIVISTHSPYFVDLAALGNGAHLVRVATKEAEGTLIHELSNASKTAIAKLIRDINNPHVLGLSARELFFQEDGVILTEGQEDAVLYPEVFGQLSVAMSGAIFGWGVGGADKMEKIASILDDLGFEKVVGILDGDKEDLVPKLADRFPRFHFMAIPAKDVRTKPAREATNSVKGLLDEKRVIRGEYYEPMKQMALKISDLLK